MVMEIIHGGWWSIARDGDRHVKAQIYKCEDGTYTLHVSAEREDPTGGYYQVCDNNGRLARSVATKWKQVEMNTVPPALMEAIPSLRMAVTTYATSQGAEKIREVKQ